MKFVVDANVLFSGLMSRKSIYEDLFQKFNIFCPDYTLIELSEYKKVILKKIPNQRKEFEEFVYLVFSNLTIIPDLLLTEEVKKKAWSLCKEIDLKDTPYVALSIFLQAKLVTRDKPLHDHLKAKGFKNIIMFHEFVEEFLK